MIRPYPKPPKKKKKKRIVVTDNTYYKTYTRDKGICRLCGTPHNLQLHHIVYRSESKELINAVGNCVMLCARCHTKVHENKHYWQPILFKIVKEKEEGNYEQEK